MADDNGLVADLEADIVTRLTAITLTGDTVFRTVDHWRFQLVSGDSFKSYAPFAFVEYDGTSRTSWEGDHDLKQTLMFTIRVGTEIKAKDGGASRIGVGTDGGLGDRQLGVSRLRDLVIDAMQREHPTTTDVYVDYWEYLSDDLVWSLPDQSAIMMKFQVDRID
ncbi:MAG: hypothetical protein GY841_04505 [FCB group bacterium]|nr:hypothetical protein [FCB group bacterium]